jgi:predicted nucleic acid-binding Zn ribbon protein
MMSPQRQRTTVTILVVVLGLSMVLGMVLPLLMR